MKPNGAMEQLPKFDARETYLLLIDTDFKSQSLNTLRICVRPNSDRWVPVENVPTSSLRWLAEYCVLQRARRLGGDRIYKFPVDTKLFGEAQNDAER